MLPNPHARRRIARPAAGLLGIAALVLLVLAWRGPPAAAFARTDATTGFDHIAVFAAGTPGTAIDAWRASVLGHVHVEACAGGHACLRRLLHLSRSGGDPAEMLAFDLDLATPAAERAAILAAAAAAEPHAVLHDATRAQRLAAR